MEVNIYMSCMKSIQVYSKYIPSSCKPWEIGEIFSGKVGPNLSSKLKVKTNPQTTESNNIYTEFIKSILQNVNLAKNINLSNWKINGGTEEDNCFKVLIPLKFYIQGCPK